MPMALEGIRILDMTQGQHGPVGTQMLADLGADVIKIEDPVSGDPARGLMAVWGKKVPLNYYFELNNRNKRAITLDLKKEKAKEILFKLVEKADVFVTNYRAAGIKRLGLDYQRFSKINPRIIYAHAYGFGKEGPDADKMCLDPAAQARGGICTISGEGSGVPVLLGAGAADQVGAGMLAFGIAVALVAQQRTGLGQEVNVSLLGSQAWMGSLALQEYLLSGELNAPLPRKEAANPLWNLYRCQDGKWVCLAMLWSDRFWPDFCKVMGLEHLEKDPRFETSEKRTKNSRELIIILDDAFARKPREEWKKQLDGRDLIWGPVNSYAEVAADPQIIANEYVVDFDHPAGKRIKMVGFPVKLSKTPGKIRMPAPEFGQHTEEILLELGYSWDDIVSFRDKGVI
jgi:CoA:oxalate CoA-transferase